MLIQNIYSLLQDPAAALWWLPPIIFTEEIIQCSQPATKSLACQPRIPRAQCWSILLLDLALTSGCGHVRLGEWKTTDVPIHTPHLCHHGYFVN